MRPPLSLKEEKEAAAAQAKDQVEVCLALFLVVARRNSRALAVILNNNMVIQAITMDQIMEQTTTIRIMDPLEDMETIIMEKRKRACQH